MSYRYGYSSRRKSRSRYSTSIKVVTKKELVVFSASLILFIVMTLFSPDVNIFPSVLGKESVKNISLINQIDLSMLLADSIPGMSLKADSHSRYQENTFGDMTNRQMPLKFSEPPEFNADDTTGISFVPVQKSASGEIKNFLIATPQDSLSLKNTAVSVEEKQPLVLIYHTHTTESFVPFSGGAFSTNMEKTVVVLGNYLTEILQEKYGIPVLHYYEVFDIPRRSAYEKARPSVEKILAEYPGIEIVLDLHRDGVPRNITTTSINGQDTGRILFVLGSNHQGWNNNLRFALFLQDALEEVSPGLSRGIRKQPFTYNQHLHQRSLIVEIGGHENSMEEVKRTIPYLAEALAAVME